MENTYFEYAALEYDHAYKGISDVRSLIFYERKRIVSILFDIQPGIILDAGCGPGVYTDFLSKAEHISYGIDISINMINVAHKKCFPRAHFSVGSVEHIPFPDNSFDGVLCIGVLEYLSNLDCAIQEISRVIKQNGIAIFTIPNKLSILNVIDALLRVSLKLINRVCKSNFIKSVIDPNYELHTVSAVTLNKILEKEGFKIEKEYYHIFRLSFLNKIAPNISFLISKKMNFISHPFFGINYIVKCRK